MLTRQRGAQVETVLGINPLNSTVQVVTKRDALLHYVDTCQHTIIDQFIEQAPASVVAAMQTTVRNQIGTLPPQWFSVNISSGVFNYRQLFYTYMNAGYIFR